MIFSLYLSIHAFNSESDEKSYPIKRHYGDALNYEMYHDLKKNFEQAT